MDGQAGGDCGGQGMAFNSYRGLGALKGALGAPDRRPAVHKGHRILAGPQRTTHRMEGQPTVWVGFIF